MLLGLARDKGFKGLVAMRGNVALSLAREYRPTAISLDIFLPDMLGWTILSHLKRDPATRHIPVQIVTIEEERQHGLEHGAFAYLNKTSTTEGLEAAFERIQQFTKRTVRRLLIVDDDQAERDTVISLGGAASNCLNFIQTVENTLAELAQDLKHYNRQERHRFQRRK